VTAYFLTDKLRRKVARWQHSQSNVNRHVGIPESNVIKVFIWTVSRLFLCLNIFPRFFETPMLSWRILLFPPFFPAKFNGFDRNASHFLKDVARFFFLPTVRSNLLLPRIQATETWKRIFPNQIDCHVEVGRA
jgi:hypothetical protein